MSAAFVGSSMGQYYYISKRKTRKKYVPKIDEYAAMEIELWQLLQLVDICMYMLTERIYLDKKDRSNLKQYVLLCLVGKIFCFN